jgi:hypothetical protein
LGIDCSQKAQLQVSMSENMYQEVRDIVIWRELTEMYDLVENSVVVVLRSYEDKRRARVVINCPCHQRKTEKIGK